jgi:flavin prenyltransferase
MGGGVTRMENVVSSPIRIIVGISGSSSPIYGIRTLESLAACGVETHLVVSKGAEQTIGTEMRRTVASVQALAHTVYHNADLGAAISSGSFPTDGMIVVPCSMKTLAAIAHSFSTDLLARAADVTLKERRRLVLVPRETPLHLGHLRNMVRAAEIGAVILPPVPAFYHDPKNIDDIINQTVGKILDQFHLPHGLFRRWSGAPSPDVTPPGTG